MRSLRFHKRPLNVVDLTECEEISRPAQHHFDLIKSGISDGVTSSTGLFDETSGDVPSIFSQQSDKFELADELLRAGISRREAQKVASDGSAGLEK